MDNKFPLSGDVSQMWALWLKSLSQQTGFININNVNSGDAGTEQKIVEDVAGYGRQLGWVTEILEIILDRVKVIDPTDNEKASLAQFYNFTNQVKLLKKKSSPPKMSLGKLDLIISEIEALKKKDEKAYAEMVARIKKAFIE
jgi:hypothetical protein